MDLAENDVLWDFDDGQREASISRFSFRLEESLESEMRLGFGIGYMHVRLRGNETSESRSFDAQYLEFFMRQPFTFNDHFGLHWGLSYRYNTGNDSGEDDSADIGN